MVDSSASSACREEHGDLDLRIGKQGVSEHHEYGGLAHEFFGTAAVLEKARQAQA